MEALLDGRLTSKGTCSAEDTATCELKRSPRRKSREVVIVPLTMERWIDGWRVCSECLFGSLKERLVIRVVEHDLGREGKAA